jgi:hypothetical protein
MYAKNTSFSDSDTVHVQFPNGTIRAEIAISFLKHAAGLSMRPSLASDAGMLFIFTTPQSPTFWMKGMKFPLDFVWLKNNIVVDINKNIPAPTNILDFELIKPNQQSDMVLEVNAGTIEKMKINTGDRIEITKSY